MTKARKRRTVANAKRTIVAAGILVAAPVAALGTHACDHPFNGGLAGDPGGGSGGGGGGGSYTTDEARTMVMFDQVGLYSYNSSNPYCSGTAGVVDPITFVIHTVYYGANYPTTPPEEHIAHHGWGHNASAGSQYFHRKEPNGSRSCVATQFSLSDHHEIPGLLGRYHLRGTSQPCLIDWGDGNIWYVSGTTPHYDSLTWCGHTVKEDWYGDGTMVSGFDRAREVLAEAFLPAAHGHHSLAIRRMKWGNTIRIKKCDGQMPQSNGWGYALTSN